MARKSPPVVNTGCTWPMFRIFNFSEGHSKRELVSGRKHLNTHATGNGNLRSSSDVIGTVDEKYPPIGVSSRRRNFSCKSISNVENDQVADPRNEVTKMMIDQRFSKKFQGKDGAGCQPNQLLDGLQILYSNKELFLKLLKDPNSLLVKQIHDLPNSQVKEPYQVKQKRITRLNKFQNSNVMDEIMLYHVRQCGKPFKSFDRYDSSCIQNKKVVLKPGTINVNFTNTSFGCPQASSHSSFSYNAQNIKPSQLHLVRIKRNLKYVMKVRRKKQQERTTNGVHYRFTCGCQGFEDGKKVNIVKIAGRNSPNCVHSSTKKGLNSSLDLKRRDKLNKVYDSEFCTRQEEVASFGESSSSRNTNNPPSPSEQDILNNVHVEGSKSLSEMLNFGVEERKQCANSPGRTSPLPDFDSLPSLPSYCEHHSVTEGMKYDKNYHQMVLRTKSGLRKEGGNSFFSSLGQKTNGPPEAPSENLQLIGSDIRIRKSPPGHNLHAHYDIPIDGGFKNTPTQNFDINDATRGIRSFLDSYPESQIFSFSPEVASSSPSPSQRIEDNINMRNRIEHPSTESVVEHFTREDVTNSQMTLFKPDASPVQVFEVSHFEDLIRPSLGLINNLTSSKDILDYVREILHACSFKWDELFMKYESSNQMLDLSTFDELNGLLTGQLSSNKILLDSIIETFMEVYKNNGFPPKRLDIQAYVVNIVMVKEITALINLHTLPHPYPITPHPYPITLEQLVEKDLAKSGSWLNINVGIEDILIELEEDVLEKMVLEIVFEMDIRSMIHCNEPCLL